MQIITGKIVSAQKVVVYGPEGIGKSTLASKFPRPVFIDTEGSTKHMDVPRTPTPSSWTMVVEQVKYVKSNPTMCDTLVIDTADWSERMCIEHLCARDQKDGIEGWGYGKGYTYLAEEFGRLLDALTELIELNINVVFVAHAQIRKFEQPDEIGAFDRWEMKLQRKTAPMLKEWADMVLFCNYKTFVINVDGQGAEKGKNKVQGGKRVIYTTHHPCWDAKNRHNLPEEIPMSYDAFAHCIPSRAQLSGQVVQSPAPKPEPKPAPKLETPKAQKAEPKPEIPSLESEGVPKALADLMRTNSVTLDEVHAVIVDKGYFPAGTPFKNYPQDFVEGVLIAAWSQVFDAIKKLREEVPF